MNKLILLLTVVAFVGCSDFLDVSPESHIREVNFYKDAKEIDLAVLASYRSLYQVLENEWGVTELRSDNSQKEYGLTDVPKDQLDRFFLNSQHVVAHNYWKSCYATIGNANKIIENIGVVDDVVLSATYEAEARFLRAFQYFNLVRLYGSVFMVTSSLSPEEGKVMTRTPYGEIYKKVIIPDLKFAMENLPAQREEGRERVNKWAAQAMLSKVYLTVGKDSLAKARLLLEDIVAQSGYKLETNYSDVFSPDNEQSNKEMLFSVAYASGGQGTGSPFGNYFAPRNSGNTIIMGSGNGYNEPTDDIVNSYGNDDMRYEAIFDTLHASVPHVFVRKYLAESQTVRYDGDHNWPVIRYADVLLMLGEVINEIDGPNGQALDYLNEVRNRAIPTNPDEYDTTNVTTKYDYRLIMEQERRLEFAFENQRWFDLLRTNRAYTVMLNHFANDPNYENNQVTNLEQWQMLLPIPQYEIDINPTIAQNAGY